MTETFTTTKDLIKAVNRRAQPSPPEPDYKAMWEKLKYWLKHLAPGVTLNQKFQVENDLVLAKITALETAGPTETQEGKG